MTHLQMYTPVNVSARFEVMAGVKLEHAKRSKGNLLTRSWLVELESSSGKGMYTAKAMQLAKIAINIKISNGLR